MEMQITATAEREHFFPAWVDGIQSSLRDDYEAAQERIAASITGSDLIDELVDVADTLADLARQGDADAIGAIVIAVQSAYVQRLTDREIFGKPGADAKDARQAAIEAMRQIVDSSDTTRNALIRAHLKAAQERFA